MLARLPQMHGRPDFFGVGMQLRPGPVESRWQDRRVRVPAVSNPLDSMPPQRCLQQLVKVYNELMSVLCCWAFAFTLYLAQAIGTLQVAFIPLLHI